MNASDLSDLGLKVLKFMLDGKKHQAVELTSALQVPRSTLRRTLDRLNSFGLLEETADPLNRNRSLFQVTKEGKTLAAKSLYVKKDEVPVESPQPKIDVIQWLRSMATSFTQMADDLEA